jgi:hypothetical protein
MRKGGEVDHAPPRTGVDALTAGYCEAVRTECWLEWQTGAVANTL